MTYSKKQYKEISKEVCESLHAKNKKPEVFNAKFVGLQFNDKGGFYSAIFEIELVVKNKKGEINFMKDIQIPMNLMADISLYEPTEKPKKEKKSADDVELQ